MKTTNRVTTRTFKSGNSIAVRIPSQFNVEPGKTFEIRRRGNALVLSQRDESLASLIEIFKSFPPDFMAEGRYNPPPESGPDFDAVFATSPAANPAPRKSKAKVAKKP